MTKLGPHIILFTAAAQRWAANAPIVKQAFGVSTLRLARSGAITICRPIHMLVKDGQQAAREILAWYTMWKFIPTYTELWNEFDEWGRAELRERLRQGRIAGDILRQHGTKVGDNIASTGTLEGWEWEIVKAEGYGGMDFIPVHEYWGNEGFTTWHALRYRRAHDILGPGHPSLIVTETGRDKVEGGQGGWGTDGISAEQFVNECVAYNDELCKDPYVLGATLFTCGPTPDWENFNADELVGRLIERLKEEPMPVDQIKAWLVDMWERQIGKDKVNTNDDPFFAYALDVARTQGRVIVPMPSKDGFYLNYSDSDYILAYTIPPMWALKTSGPIMEGFPKKV